MDASTAQLLGAASVLAINRLAFLGPPWASWFPRFWFIQLLNLVATVYLILWGIPDFREGATHIVDLVLAALIVFHSVRNNQRFQKERLKLARAYDEETLARMDAVRERVAEDAEE